MSTFATFKYSLPIFYKHWIAGSYQLAVLRDGLALARMLGRILILPKLMSWCDLDYTPDIITDCIVRYVNMRSFVSAGDCRSKPYL